MRTIFFLFLAALFLSGCARSNTQATLRIDRTFHKPLVFQVEREGEKLFLRVIIYDGLGGYDKGQVQSDTRRPLTETEAATVRSALAAVEASPPTDPMPSYFRDGSLWYYTGGGIWPFKLKVLTPHSSKETRGTGSLYELGQLLWRLGEIPEPEKNFY